VVDHLKPPKNFGQKGWFLLVRGALSGHRPEGVIGGHRPGGVISGQKFFWSEKSFWECFILDIWTLLSLFTKNNRKVLLLLKVCYQRYAAYTFTKVTLQSSLPDWYNSNVWPAFDQWEHWISHFWPIRAPKRSSATNANRRVLWSQSYIENYPYWVFLSTRHNFEPVFNDNTRLST
jgi:hypothetical protein